MLFFSSLICFSAFCLIVGAGIQSRKKWAWYAGWGIQFFTAGTAFSQITPLFFLCETPLQYTGAFVSLAGALCVWCFWAVFWANQRNEFHQAPAKPKS